MRRGSESLKRYPHPPVFLFNLPSTITESALSLYISELKRLGAFLEELGGMYPSSGRLGEVMKEFETARRQILSSRKDLTSRAFSEKLFDFFRSGNLDVDLSSSSRDQTGIPMAVLGGPLEEKYLLLLDEIEINGGEVVLDGTETGERTLPRFFDFKRLREAPLLELADSYFGHIPDAFRRPNDQLYRWLKLEIEKRNIAGIILIRRLWCDIWHGEVQRIREEVGIPILDLDLDGENPESRNRTRIQAFLEVLR